MTPARFWDRAAPKYSERPIGNMAAYEAGLARVRSHLTGSDRLLELGCGTGGTARRLAPHVSEVTATDISPAMIEIARTRAAEESVTNITHLTATLEGGLPAGPFDVVAGFNLIHLLPDPERDIARIRDLVKPGGLFISKTPCLTGLFGFLRPVIGAMRLAGRAPKVHFLSPARLDRAVTAAGFEIIETGTYPKSPPGHLIVARRV